MWKLLEDDLKRYISLQNYDSDVVKQISDYIIVFICGYATCCIIDQGVTTTSASWTQALVTFFCVWVTSKVSLYTFLLGAREILAIFG